MNEFCAFATLTVGSECINGCGYRLKRTYTIPPVRGCERVTPACRFLGPATNEIALIKCESCQGNVRKKFPIHECAIFGRCLPTYSGIVDDGHGCIGCDRREALLPEPLQ